MTDFLLKTREGPVAVWTLNRPDSRNAFSKPEDMFEIEDACEEVRARAHDAGADVAEAGIFGRLWNGLKSLVA